MGALPALHLKWNWMPVENAPETRPKGIWSRWTSWASEGRLVGVAILLITVIGLADWRIETNVGLGFLYFFPMLLLGASLKRAPIVGGAVVCAVLREAFSPFGWGPDAITRSLMVFAAFLGSGFYVAELSKNRKLAVDHLHRIAAEASRRQEAEEQLRILIESSPAAIITVAADHRVLQANDAAHRLLACEQGKLQGEQIQLFLPALVSVPRPRGEARQFFRTAMECQGRRSNGERFLASIWFSTYQTESGPRLAAIIADASEELRDRDEFSLNQLLTSTRILIGAVSHEIRNCCAAISVVHSNLSRNAAVAQSEDFKALGSLVRTLEDIASTELQRSKDSVAQVDLRSVLDELRIVIESPFAEAGIETRWDIPEHIPAVLASRQSLLQVFLNLAKNSERAMSETEIKQLRISVSIKEARVVVQVSDTGHGVAAPERLFRPFQSGAEATGLGLYVSRALIRAFGGDLRYEPQPAGCCFRIELPAVLARQGIEDESLVLRGSSLS